MKTNVSVRRSAPQRALALLAILWNLPLASDATNIPVTTLADSDFTDGECSLREAIQAANLDAPHADCPGGSGPSDRILLVAPGTILLTSNLPELTESAAILGLGPEVSAIDGQGARALLRLDSAGSGQAFRIERLTLTRGGGTSAGAGIATGGHLVVVRDATISNSVSSDRGGGIAATEADLLLDRAWLSSNSATGSTGGGAIYALGGSLRILSSTVEGNTTTSPSGGGGGILMISGTAAAILDSTLSGNSTLGTGGGAYFNGTNETVDLEVQVFRSTITQNHANTDGLNNFHFGGGLALAGGAVTSANLHLVNSILAENTDGSPSAAAPDLLLFGLASATSQGFNVVGDNSTVEIEFPAGLPNANGDGVGTNAAPLDPQLEPLADLGGGTPVHAPTAVALSVLIDKGNCPGARSDQRGRGDATTGLRRYDAPGVANNPAGDSCDIGSVELGPLTPIGARELLVDGFESGTLLFWDSDVP